MLLFGQALLIFTMRVADQTLGTLRIVMLISGRRVVAGILGFFESMLWLLAVASVVGSVDSPVKVVAFAGGFAAGTMLGGTVEQWIGLGKNLIRVIAPVSSPPVAEAIRELGYGATVVNGEGLDGNVRITFSVVPRRQVRGVMESIRQVNNAAFVTAEGIETVDLHSVRRWSLRK